jgi:Nucleotidyl transferase AbiEii toxin, Type IV TA system
MADLEQVLGVLVASGSRYLVVGGVAVVLHGFPRFTADLDLVVSLDPANLNKALDALASLEFRPRAPVALRDFGDPSIRRDWIETKGLTVFSLWSPRFPATEVDIFVEEPFDFEDAFGRRVEAQLGFGTVSVASIHDLIALKRKAGRPKDLLDISELEKIERG